MSRIWNCSCQGHNPWSSSSSAEMPLQSKHQSVLYKLESGKLRKPDFKWACMGHCMVVAHAESSIGERCSELGRGRGRRWWHWRKKATHWESSKLLRVVSGISNCPEWSTWLLERKGSPDSWSSIDVIFLGLEAINTCISPRLVVVVLANAWRTTVSTRCSRVVQPKTYILWFFSTI